MKKFILFLFLYSALLLAASNQDQAPKTTAAPHRYLRRSTGRAAQVSPMSRARTLQTQEHYTIERRQGSCGSLSSLDPVAKSTEPCPTDD